ncbi:MAG: hypothetical protein JNK85_26580 [Verrucomicrobiales bacterium]|nr:hypothetical protein [Verrucomicrobiales bacterium]
MVKTKIFREYYPNGKPLSEQRTRAGVFHGTSKTWHRNGALASEARYAYGLMHGISRQWDPGGKLLGESVLVHGTGIVRHWHDNGKLAFEMPTDRGVPHGCNRSWLYDGTLNNLCYYILGKPVTAAQYRSRAKIDKSLKVPVGRNKPPSKGPKFERKKHDVFVKRLLDKPVATEAREWVDSSIQTGAKRILGRLRGQSRVRKLVKDLYAGGAKEVIAAGVYPGTSGSQHADWLVVRLPASATMRRALWRCGRSVEDWRVGILEPSKDQGEKELVVIFT